MQQSNRGFSLVEMSIVLIIATLILGTVLKAINAMQYGTKVKETRTNLALIKEALLRYYAVNGRLPCPADPTISDNPICANFNKQGIQGEVPANRLSLNNACGLTTAEFRLGSNSLDGRAYRGSVPWKTLGLSREMAQDGYFNQIDYVVSARAIVGWDANSTTGSNWVYLDRTMPQAGMLYGNLVINSNTSPPVEVSDSSINQNTGVVENRPVFVLLSHGQNAYGARTFSETNQGSCVAPKLPRDILNSGLGENENINNDKTFTADSIGPSTGANAYDDLTVYATAGEVKGIAMQSGDLKLASLLLKNQFDLAEERYFKRVVESNKATCKQQDPASNIKCYNLVAPVVGTTTLFDFTEALPDHEQPYYRNGTDCPATIDGSVVLPLQATSRSRRIRPLSAIYDVPPVVPAMNRPKPVLDPWGREIRYAVGPSQNLGSGAIPSCNTVAFVSFGPDGRTGAGFTKDDVVHVVGSSQAVEAVKRLAGIYN